MSGTIQAWSNEIIFDWENETGSAPQQSDINAWINAFENGASQSNLIVDLAVSQAAGNAIGNAYEQVLGRWVDPSGYQGCVNILASGGGLQTIEQDLAQSGECYNDIVGMFENATGGNAPSANLISVFQYLLGNGIWSQTDCQSWLAGVGSQINGVYESVLGRAADPGALAWGLNQVVAGVSLTTITQEVASSGECYNDIVRMFENATGGNAPNADLVAAFQYNLANGIWSQTDCQNWLAGVGSQINGVYESVLGRAADPGGLAWGLNQVAAGVSLTTITQEVASSGECYNDIVRMFENATGGNAPNADLVAAFQYNLANGIWSQTDCQNWLAGVGSQINGVYESVLGRAADPGGLAWGLNQVAAGVSLTTITQEVASSGECYNDIVRMFENATGGNAPNADLVAAFQYNLANGIWSQTDCQNWLAGVGSQINGVYESVLGRAADPGGLAWGLNQVAAGVSLTTITQEVASSGECYNDIVRMFENATGGNAPNADLVAAFQYNLANGIWSQTDCQNWLAGVGSQINGIYESVLGRAVDPTGLAACLNQVASGVSMTSIAQELAASQEAASDINGVYEQVMNRPVDPTGLAMGQTILASGGGLAGLRSALAQSAEAQADMNALYQQVLGRPATASDLAWAQGALASGASWAQIQADIANSPEAQAAVNAVYEQVLGRAVDAGLLAPAMAALGTEGYAGLEASLATSAEAAGDINAIYEQVLGRAVDPNGLATYEGVLAQGGTLATVQMDVAQSAEAAGVVQNFYQITFGRAATADELVGMQYAIGLAVSDTDQFGLYAANGTCLALTTSGNLLTQLAVAVTLDNGATPILSLPGGGTELFANATQLAAALLGLSLQQSQASVASLSAYQATVNWLVQIDQPMLQVAANLLSQVQLAQSEGNQAQATLASTAYQLALQIAALPPAARGGANWGLSASVQVNGHTTDVIVYNDTSSPYGNVVYHDKPNDPILGIVEEVATVAVDILAAFQPEFTPLAAVLAAAEAGQGFAEGNVLGGVLQLANAVGFGEFADGAAATGSEILAVSQAVGGASGIVQSAENGDALGAIAGALTIAAAAASQGIGINGNQSVVSAGTVTLDGTTINLGLNVTQTLAALAATGTVADALNNGDVSTALITSLGTLFSTIATNVQVTQSQVVSAGQAIISNLPDQTQGQIVSETNDAPYQVAANGAAVPGPLSPDVQALKNQLATLSQSVADQFALDNNLSDMLPTQIGSMLHKAFADAVAALNIPGVSVETSRSFSNIVSYGQFGSIRTDVTYTDASGQVLAVFDYKTTGDADTYNDPSPISAARAARIRASLFAQGAEVNNSIPVIGIRVILTPITPP